MKELTELQKILEKLLAPDGCPWDREQTLQTMRGSLLEEACEVIEAIDLNDNRKMEEELGDLFFNVLFICRLAEKEGRFTTADTLQHIIAKLIRRHPHIFGTAKVDNAEQVLVQWEEIKKKEKTSSSLMDEVPKTLPSLARGQKMIKKLGKLNYQYGPAMCVEEHLKGDKINDEDSLGKALFQLLKKAESKGLNSEIALTKLLNKLEGEVRHQGI